MHDVLRAYKGKNRCGLSFADQVCTLQQGEDKKMVMDLLRDNAILKKGV